ncbi:hypothetical protein, partial [Nocardioides limicola]|uniref:hypothetical protein n=1 Tax=Nocardioides limicola TaxID=2803368 RepID=UPI001EEFB450
MPAVWCGLLGGLCWLAAFVAARVGLDRDHLAVIALTWTGLGLVLVAAALTGLTLVAGAPI